MKKWHLIYDAYDKRKARPVWGDEPPGIFMAVIVGDEKGERGGRQIVVKGVVREGEGFRAELARVRVVNAARELLLERMEPEPGGRESE